MRKIFITATHEEAGKNWDLCWFGTDTDGKDYGVTSNSLHGTDFFDVFSHGPKKDAELVARLLNAYWGNKVFREALDAVDGEATND